MYEARTVPASLAFSCCCWRLFVQLQWDMSSNPAARDVEPTGKQDGFCLAASSPAAFYSLLNKGGDR